MTLFWQSLIIRMERMEKVSLCRSLMLSKNIIYDLVMVTCAHTNIDYNIVQRNAQDVFDIKNVMKGAKARENIEVL